MALRYSSSSCLYLSLSLSLSISICLSLSLSVSLSICVSVSLYVSVCLCLFLFLNASLQLSNSSSVPPVPPLLSQFHLPCSTASFSGYTCICLQSLGSCFIIHLLPLRLAPSPFSARLHPHLDYIRSSLLPRLSFPSLTSSTLLSSKFSHPAIPTLLVESSTGVSSPKMWLTCLSPLPCIFPSSHSPTPPSSSSPVIYKCLCNETSRE